MSIPISAGRRGEAEPPTKLSKRKGLTGRKFLERSVARKEEGDFFFMGVGGRCNFYIRNKLKSEIFNDESL